MLQVKSTQEKEKNFEAPHFIYITASKELYYHITQLSQLIICLEHPAFAHFPLGERASVRDVINNNGAARLLRSVQTADINDFVFVDNRARRFSKVLQIGEVNLQISSGFTEEISQLCNISSRGVHSELLSFLSINTQLILLLPTKSYKMFQKQKRTVSIEVSNCG